MTDQGAQLSGRPAAIPVPPWVPKEAVLTQGGVARQIVSVACTRTDVSHRATAARRVPENQFFRKSYEASNLPVERARGMAGGVVKLGGRAAHRRVRAQTNARGQKMIPLLVRVLGAAADDVNPGWDGHVSADEAFVALLVAETSSTLHWAKAEPAAPSGLPLSVRCHPLAEPSLFQFMFILGFGWITSLKGSAAKPVRPRLAIPDQLPAGRLVTIATVESSPPISAGLLFLARSDVSVGRNRIWRPHKALFGELPNALHPALSGSRNGSYEVNHAW